MDTKSPRKCGLCGDADIPRGVDWPWWYAGMPVHDRCHPSHPSHLSALALQTANVSDAKRLADGLAVAIGDWIDATPQASVTAALKAIDEVRAALVSYREKQGELMNDTTKGEQS